LVTLVVALEDVVIGMIQSVIHLTNNTMVEVVLVVPEAVVHGMDVAVQMIFVEKSML
jgi:hypothetical protein